MWFVIIIIILFWGYWKGEKSGGESAVHALIKPGPFVCVCVCVCVVVDVVLVSFVGLFLSEEK